MGKYHIKVLRVMGTLCWKYSCNKCAYCRKYPCKYLWEYFRRESADRVAWRKCDSRVAPKDRWHSRLKNNEHVSINESILLKEGCPKKSFLTNLSSQICHQNLTNFLPCDRNSTAIMASIFMRLHVANPRSLDRFLRFIVLCFFRKKKMSHFASDAMFMLQFSRKMSPLLYGRLIARWRNGSCRAVGMLKPPKVASRPARV